MEENSSKEKYVDIRPLGKGKRILAFLADYFIALILSFTLFNLAIFPLAKVMFNTEAKSKEITELEKTSNGILIDSKLMYVDTYLTNEFNNNVNYTFKVFLSYYAYDEEKVDDKNPQFGHKQENEVIYHYLVEMKNNESGYISAFKEVNTDNYFTIGEDAKSVTLKSEYKTLLASELLEVTDEEKYSETMVNFRDHVFAKLYYLHVYNDILKNDLVLNGVSYKECMEKISSISYSLSWIASVSAVISVAISSAIFYILIPCINKDRKTIALMMMKIYRVNKKTFTPGSRLEVAINGLYQFIINMSYALFLPVLYFGLAYCFNLPLLIHFLFIGGVIMLSSMGFIFINEYNRSMTDILTISILIPDEEIDNLYKVE